MNFEISNVTSYPRVLITARVTGADPLQRRLSDEMMIPDQIEVEYRQTGYQPGQPWEILSLAVFNNARTQAWWPDNLDEAPQWVQTFVAEHMPNGSVLAPHEQLVTGIPTQEPRSG